MPDSFSTENSPKQGDALSPLLFNLTLECTIKEVQENQELKGTHMLLVYADDNILGKNMNTIHKNRQALSESGREIGL